jgi:hypothetical protein
MPRALILATNLTTTQTWHGHSAFPIEAGDAKLLIDPFLSDNPSRDNGWSGYLTGKNSTQGLMHALCVHETSPFSRNTMSLRFSYDTPATMKRHAHGDTGDLRWDSRGRLKRGPVHRGASQ